MMGDSSLGDKVRYALGYAVALFAALIGLGAVSAIALSLLEEGFGAAMQVVPSSALLGVLAVGLFRLGIRIAVGKPRRSRVPTPTTPPTEHVEPHTPAATSASEPVSQPAPDPVDAPRDAAAPAEIASAVDLGAPSAGNNAKKDYYGVGGKNEASAASFTPQSAPALTPASAVPVAFPTLMGGQLVARYKQTHDQAYHEEYLRRLQHLGFDDQEAERLFVLELMMIKHDAVARLADEGYLKTMCFDLKHVALPKGDDYYITHQMFLVSEIVKIWDEAEWHYFNSHEADLPADVWAEIKRISRYGGGELFIGYLQMVAEKSSVPFEKVQAYSAAEQNLIFKYKWNADKNEPHPYGA